MSGATWRNNKTRRVLDDGSIERLCKTCGEWKPLLQMAKHSQCADGRAPRCKPCENVREQLRRARAEALDEQRLAKTLSDLAREREQKDSVA